MWCDCVSLQGQPGSLAYPPGPAAPPGPGAPAPDDCEFHLSPIALLNIWKFLIDLNRLSFWQTSHLIWVPLSVSFCSKSACLHFVCVSLYFRNSVLNETNFVWCDEVLTDTVFPYRQGSCKVRCCCWAGPIDKVDSLLIFTFLYKPPRTFAGIRRSLFRTQARQRERWWTVRSLPPARTADFLAAVFKLQASCDIQVTGGFPNVRGNLRETSEKCYF